MSNCEQTKGMSVLQHGQSVYNYVIDLINHLETDQPLKYQWRLPEWMTKDLLCHLPSIETLELYTTYHDCGKPFCQTIDENGRKHFPNHAEVSFGIFNQVFNDPLSATLILHDMDIHLMKAIDVEQFCLDNKEIAITLLIVALCEIHSNATMFGGLDSDSFKIKWKCLNQRGKQIIKTLI